MTFTFPAAVAWDPIGKQAVKNTSFQVFTVADTGFVTPLAITDTFGAALPGNILNSGTQGVFPEFKDTTESTVVITDPTRTYVWTVNAVMQDTSVAAFVAQTGSATALAVKNEVTAGATATALSATFVPKWKATTAYLAGDAVLSPAGDTVTAKVNFTSGASYSAANWNYSTNYAPQATTIPKWVTAAAYTAGQQVISPNGDVVSAIADHTSGASFTPANWNLSASFATPAQAFGNAIAAALIFGE